MPAAHSASGPSTLAVSVKKLQSRVQVRVRSAVPLGRHFLAATGGAGNVRLRIPGASAVPSKIPVGVGTVRSITVQPGSGEVILLVERSAPGEYRSTYAGGRHELVLEVDAVAGSPAVAAPTAAHPAVAAGRRAPAVPVAPAAPPVGAPPVLRAAAVPQTVALLPGVWHSYGAPERPRRLVTLDFVNADVQDVVKALAIQSGANILVAPKVEGKVTVGLRNVTPEQALEYIVRLGGLAYGLEDGTYVVCTTDQISAIFPPGTRGKILFPPPAPAGGAPDSTKPAAAPKVKAVRLTRLTAAEAAPVLQKLVPGLEVQAPDPKLMVLVGPEDQVSSAETAITTLEAAVPEPPTPQTVEAGGQQPRGPVPPKDVEIDVYELKHVKAAEAATLLKGFMNAHLVPEVVVVPAPSPAYPVTAGDKSGTTTTQKATTADTSEAFLNLLYGRAGLSAEAQAGAPVAGEGAAAPGTDAQPGAAGAKASPASAVLVPKESTTNKLLLIGARDSVAAVRRYLEKIDVAPRQVMIDVKVTDVSLTDQQQLGVMWSWGNLGIQESAPAASEVIPELQLGRFGHVPVNFNATLEAMLKTQKARLLANPRVAVMDGRTASIHVGDTVRYLAQRTAGINGTTVQIGEENVGVVVTVAPRIGGDNIIVLDVRPKVNVIVGYTPTGDGGQVPNTSERSIETVVRLRDGETLAIGGLIRDEDTTAMQKVPGLGDLPLVGELFKYRSRQKGSSEVLIFITPTIVPDVP